MNAFFPIYVSASHTLYVTLCDSVTLYCAYNVHVTLNCLKSILLSVLFSITKMAALFLSIGCLDVGFFSFQATPAPHFTHHESKKLQSLTSSATPLHPDLPRPQTYPLTPPTWHLGLCEELILNWAPGLILDRRNLIHFISNIIAQFSYISIL